MMHTVFRPSSHHMQIHHRLSFTNTHTLREKVFISQKPHMIRIQKHPICVFKDLNFRSDAQFVSDQPQVVSSKSMSNKPTDGLIKWTVRD